MLQYCCSIVAAGGAVEGGGYTGPRADCCSADAVAVSLRGCCVAVLLRQKGSAVAAGLDCCSTVAASTVAAG